VSIQITGTKFLNLPLRRCKPTHFEKSFLIFNIIPKRFTEQHSGTMAHLTVVEEEPALMGRVAAWYARVCRLSSGVHPHQPCSPRSFCAAGPIALRQRRHSSPDLSCHLFRLRSSVMATDQCVRSCSRPPSTGARTPSSASVDTTTEEAQRSSCSQTTSSCIEENPYAPSDTPGAAKLVPQRLASAVWGDETVCTSTIGVHKSIDSSGNYVAAHHYALYASGARLAPSIDCWGNVNPRDS